MYEQHTLGEWVIFADNWKQQEQQKQISVTGGNYGSRGSTNGGSRGDLISRLRNLSTDSKKYTLQKLQKIES